MNPAAPEIPVCFDCRGDALVGMLHATSRSETLGVVIVVGGPQYRVGSHRQFVILARGIAEAGFPCLRFDYRGMGDSDGEFKGFEAIDDDIRAAVDFLTGRVPSLERIVLWGLCDAASAILFYAHQDARVHGVVLVNPWVRTESGLARTYLKHYYRRRLFDPELWQKIRRGKFNPGNALGAFVRHVRSALSANREPARNDSTDISRSPKGGTCDTVPELMADGLSRYRGAVLLILSGNDYTAREFEDATAASARWRTMLEDRRITRRRLLMADHTFSHRDWHNQVIQWTTDWVGLL